MYRFALTPNAQRQLEHEIAYSRKKWGTAHASQYRRELMKRVRAIAKNPKLYTINPELGENIRSVRYKGNYIIYEIDEPQKLVVIAGFPSVYKSK
jgi:plasmid stabilization system protein ParE